jgi:cytoskeletal protein CcmA (bactofilin family)
LVVQGSVQVTLNETRAIEITESGRFTNGKAEVEEAEISGVYEGDLTVRNRLLIRSTGRVQGNVRLRRDRGRARRARIRLRLYARIGHLNAL